MSPELRAALEAKISETTARWNDWNKVEIEDDRYAEGAIDTILRYAECNPNIPDRALCQCWGDVIKAAIPAALWDRVSKEG